MRSRSTAKAVLAGSVPIFDRAALVVLVLSCAGAGFLVPDAPWRHLGEPTHQAAIAMVAVLAILLVLRALGPRGARLERAVLAVFLASMPLVYVGAWFRAGAGGSIGTEVAGVFLFAPLALIGLVRAPQVLAIGIAAHGLWDLAHYGRSAFMPDWYALGCAVADAGVATYAAARVGRWREASAAAANAG
jgi:hypothetical protein